VNRVQSTVEFGRVGNAIASSETQREFRNEVDRERDNGVGNVDRNMQSPMA
jgi:hypothetical protein